MESMYLHLKHVLVNLMVLQYFFKVTSENKTVAPGSILTLLHKSVRKRIDKDIQLLEVYTLRFGVWMLPL